MVTWMYNFDLEFPKFEKKEPTAERWNNEKSN